MAFNFTFADNQRLGLQIVGAKSTGTSEQPLGFKRAVVENDTGTAGEVMYIGGSDNDSNYMLGCCGGYYFSGKALVFSRTAGTPIFGVYIKDKNGTYIQTGGVAYVQVDAALTKGGKIYYRNDNKISSTSSNGVEIKGAVAGDPAQKITIDVRGTPTELYPIYLNNPHL